MINIIIYVSILIIILIFTFLYLMSLMNLFLYWIPQVPTYKIDFDTMKTWLWKYNLEWKKIIDLWSWTWKTLRFFEKNFKTKSTGYEIDLSNYLISIIKNIILWYKSKIYNKNLLKANLQEYDFIYMWLLIFIY